MIQAEADGHKLAVSQNRIRISKVDCANSESLLGVLGVLALALVIN